MSNSPGTYDVFISYAHADNDVVDRLCEELRRYNLSYFRDAESIRLGADWQDRLATAINGCRYFALVHSSASDSSEWVKQELSFAGIKLRKGWIRLDDRRPNDSIRLMFDRFQACIAYSGDRNKKIKEFARSIYEALEPGRIAAPATGSLKHNECPYRGLSSYDGSQSDRLYGRSSEIGALCDSIYRSVAETDTSDRNANRRLFFIYGPSGTGKTSLVSAGVLPSLAEQFHTVGPYRLGELNKSFVDYAKEAGDQPCVIALDQFEELWAESDKAIPAELFRKINDNGIHAALNKYRKLVILLSFREEYLAKMQDLFQSMDSYWNRHVVRGLSKEAEECIRGPAKEREITYEDKLVSALVNGLAMEGDQVGDDGLRPSYVEPVELQIVCERLWRELPEGIPTIHSSHLRQVCIQMDLLKGGNGAEKVDDLAAKFVDYATKGFLDTTVKMVSSTEAAKTCNYDDPDRIYFALLQFVSESNKRVSLSIHREVGGEWVGRLPIRIVKELTDNRLLRAMNVRGELRFELIHDRLAVPISEKKERLGLLYAVNSLDSAMTKVKRERKNFQGWFENYEPLIKDLTEFKKFEGLNSDEAEFVFRSALVSGPRDRDNLEAWTRTVAEQHPTVLAKVLLDAFCLEQTNGQVRINAAILLRDPWLQSRLGREQLVKILTELEKICRAITDDAQLEELCYTFASCPQQEPGDKECEHLVNVLASFGAGADIHPRNLLWMRDKVNMAAGGCFVKRWKALSPALRGWYTCRLYWLRFRHSFVRMAFIVVISAIVTGVGAGAMYAFWGISGSSFTQASSASGVGQGLFHGFFGGITWGGTLSLATLIYWLILRGRRIRNVFSHWFWGVVLSGFAGFLGGIALTVMVLSVDTPESMQAAGWLMRNIPDRYQDAFWQLGRLGPGWIFPIYGLFLGLGVGWCMLSLFHDKHFRMFVGTLKPLKTTGDFRSWASKIVIRVFLKSGPVAITMALAGISMVVLFSGRYLDTHPCQWQWNQPPPVCPSYEQQGTQKTTESQNPIAPMRWRAAGTSVIIYFGAYSLMVGYLLALLTIRFGVEVPEDKSFLGSH